MANRRPQQSSGRRNDFGRNDRNKNFGRPGVSPWQGAGPGGGIPNLLPLGGDASQATLALASNLINLLQPRQNPVPSLLDMPIRRDFGPNMGRFDRGYGPNRMGNQNFRRTGNYNRSGERVNNNRKPFRPNDGQRQQNKSSPKKEADSKAKPQSEKDDSKNEKQDNQTEVQKEPEEKKEAPKTRYDDINPQLLKCHICNKSMWDGRSFENHLTGRAHAIMMQKTAESYALTADTMRQEFKIREMKRTRKSGGAASRDFYCAMCDMYATDGAAHRTTVGHRKLKKYLHPSCTCCHKEMPTRIELDEHRLTAEHLRNMQDKQEVITKPKPEVMVISTLSMEQSYLRDDRNRNRRHRNDDKQDGDKEDGAEIKKEPEDGSEEKTEEPAKKIDNDDTILDYVEGDDLTGVTSAQFPTYSVERGVGRSFLSEFRCVQCKLCRKLLDSEETADVHLRTWRHHQLFLRLLHDHTKQQQPEQSSSDGNKRPLNSEDDGNFKRRKTTTDDDNENDNDNDNDDNEQNGHEDTSMKEVQDNEDEEQGNGDDNNQDGDGEMDGDSSMPAAEDLEDWEQSVDEILHDEQDGENGPEESNQEQEQEQDEPEEQVEEEPAKEPTPPPPANKPRATPRGRGRGRRGRY